MFSDGDGQPVVVNAKPIVIISKNVTRVRCLMLSHVCVCSICGSVICYEAVGIAHAACKHFVAFWGSNSRVKGVWGSNSRVWNGCWSLAALFLVVLGVLVGCW